MFAIISNTQENECDSIMKWTNYTSNLLEADAEDDNLTILSSGFSVDVSTGNESYFTKGSAAS